MNAFKTHEQVIEDYKSYLQSFINIKDERILNYVNDSTLVNNILPEPLIQFNPSFEKGASLQDLINEDIIHSDLSKALGSYNLYKHQVEAIRIGVQKKGFVVTSGTGSGKSLTFLATIFNEIFNQGVNKPKGVKAILVYPMNALINSQFEEIKKYASNYGDDFPITFEQYTGQEGLDKRERIKSEQPDIILTNYMMLELIMTRQSEKWLRDSMSQNLKYVVYDELHTYRGRQGADVSLLNRRIQSLCSNELIFIGTSATMASKGSPTEKKQKVAEVASQIFGKSISYKNVINEYLEPCTKGKTINPFQLATSIKKGIDMNWNEDDFIDNDLANWLELNVALKQNEGVLERGKPLNIDQITDLIITQTSLSNSQIKDALIKLLQWAEKINEENRIAKTGKSFLPFRFHQFISQTGSLSVTLEPRNHRHIETTDEKFVIKDGKERKLYPVLFSRYSGYDFICVELNTNDQVLEPLVPSKEFQNKKQSDVNLKNPTWDDLKYGYIVLDEDESFWQTDFRDLVPTEWWNRNETDLQPYYKMLLPTAIYFNTDGQFSFEEKYPIKGYYIPAKLRIDPTAQIVYEDSKTSDFTKLSRLGSEGRSTATSVISFSVVKSLMDQNENVEDQKLLSFTDNRQDASLQAGHFNDFYTTIRLRASLFKVLSEHGKAFEIYEIAEALYQSLNLFEDQYAVYPSKDPDFPDERNKEALKELLLYRILQDLKRGWRYTLPNLEQVALLEIDYKNLERLASLDKKFESISYLDQASSENRYKFLKNILDYFRTSYALDHRFFKDSANIESLMRERLSSNSIWSLDYNEKLDKPTELVFSIPRQRPKGRYIMSIGERSNLGKYINRTLQNNSFGKLRKEDYQQYVESILTLLSNANILTIETDKKNPELRYYRLRADHILWKKGDGKKINFDETRFNINDESMVVKPNQYFQKLYQTDLGLFKKELVAREHTGQIGAQDRIDREEAFRKGEISTMYCSPTMELGIDIANLNIVHMRNVPPNAANYAQRSGRAGRGGQTAVVFTYCSTMSPHDVNYFKNSAEMVAGAVQPPRIDLINEELIATHLNAYLLMKLEISELKTSAAEILDLTNEKNIFIRTDIFARIEHNINQFKSDFLIDFKTVTLSIYNELENTNWFTDNWIAKHINSFPDRFSVVFDRWIRMFQNACISRDKAQSILDNHMYKADSDEKRIATKQERFARNQISLLKNENQKNSSNSEFYIFRYLAAEGFLPGYNFTRLPVRVVLGKSYKDDVEVLSRPRSLALTEFGPANTIYHSGSKFRMNRMIISELENQTEKILISKNTGYAYFNQDTNTANVDPITGVQLKGDAAEILNNIVELSECEGTPIEKISCIEEERSRSGYDVFSYFNFSGGIKNTESVVLKLGDEKLLQIFFSKTANLIKVNKKARRSKTEGFKIDQRNGVWVQERNLVNNQELIDNTKEITLYTKDTADVLYIQPLGNIGASSEQVISLSYALKRAIEKLFLVEESEIAVSIIGDQEKPNILIHESSEGSLGILSQLLNPIKMKEWFNAAYEVIHFNPETREETELGQSLPHATYQDLLSYYNQIYHQKLNRYGIRELLEKLLDCEVEIIQGANNDREEQYRYLLDAYDKNSSTELKFIKFLYDNGYALPDIAQQNLADYFISADFIYKNRDNPVIIFVDGSVHDLQQVNQQDIIKRTALRDAGYDVVVWRYDESLEELMLRRKDIFKKVK
ncbi:DEAD/DEAH box helicase [Elizabethkingia occulta]|uniref:DEAD/DEAH box helicase n=1 Tax=Elizabethkingia occulta TaxID=1867263 RepID=UPI000999DB95|nr:DEAD/DEAH box helicase [Elizabethkingia occulta]OPB96466.1 hypothetical protein BB020_15435 [Elizabethkingia occulta]